MTARLALLLADLGGAVLFLAAIPMALVSPRHPLAPWIACAALGCVLGAYLLSLADGSSCAACRGGWPWRP